MDTLLCSKINIGSSVEVIGTDITARVNAIIMEESGIQYRIVYWHENHRYTMWVDLEELRVIK
jgi:hypothetical protein